MKTVKTSELIGASLDWAVAKCEGRVWNTYAPNKHPSTDWAQGGPIIERECINVWAKAYGTSPVIWRAQLGNEVQGNTPLIAAMRCYVASKMGDEIEIPSELY